MKKIYLDSETTGTDPKRSGLIQLSAKVIINGEIKDECNLRLKPFPDDVLDEKALEVNGISELELQASDRMLPKDAYLVFTRMLAKHVDKFNRSDKFLFFAFRAGFDSDFLREFFSKNGDTYYGSWFYTPPLCVMTLAAYILQRERSRLENFKLRTVYNYLFPDNKFTDEQWHDSMFDIDRTIDIEAELRRRVGVNLSSTRKAA